jgi:tetraacyldisaccharide 4'-kinase
MSTLPPSWLAPITAPLSFGYTLGIRLWQAAYHHGWLKTHRVGIPVVSVGNLTTGGTGKTPVVAALAKQWTQQGRRVVVLSRGYGAKTPQGYARATDPAFGDEAYWIQQQVPDAVVIVGKDRVANARRATREHRPHVIILDDGFQHRRLHRDVDILLLSAHQPLYNAKLLPAGLWREPLSAIHRAHWVWISQWDPTENDIEDWHNTMAQVGFSGPVVPVSTQLVGMVNAHDRTVAVEAVDDEPLVLFSGIAQPQRFEANLRRMGVSWIAHRVFHDHHRYTAQDVQSLIANAPASARFITTDKDWVKVESLWPPGLLHQVFRLQIAPVIPPRVIQALEHQLFRLPSEKASP